MEGDTKIMLAQARKCGHVIGLLELALDALQDIQSEAEFNHPSLKDIRDLAKQRREYLALRLKAILEGEVL